MADASNTTTALCGPKGADIIPFPTTGRAQAAPEDRAKSLASRFLSIAHQVRGLTSQELATAAGMASAMFEMPA